MMRNYFLGICLLALTFMRGDFLMAQKMPQEADKVYKDMSQAILNRDIKLLEDIMSKGGFIELRNRALSIGVKFPEEVFDMLNSSLLDFNKLTFIKYSKRGVTVNAYYTYAENGTVSSIITLRMVEEDKKLKLVSLVNHDAKDYVVNLYQKDYSFLDQPEYQPTGVVPATPEPIESIDYLAKFDLYCYGYIVSLNINSRMQVENVTNGLSGTVIGGIKKGENTIEMTLKKIDLDEKEKPFIAVRAYINGEEKEVFYLNEEVEGIVERTFRVE